MKPEATGLDTALEAYSDLLARAVCNLIYLDPSQQRRRKGLRHKLRKTVSGDTEDSFEARMERRLNGRDWPSVAHSMAGYKRLTNTAKCMLDVLSNDVPGDVIETGVWRGGACILMQGILKAAGQTHRKVYVADSFAGLPPPNAADYPEDKGDKHHTHSDALGISLETVQDNFRAYDLLEDNVVFLKGWFKDTLPGLDVEAFSIVRLDGDMYESTIQAIEVLYPKLSPGGYLIVDDYGAINACRKAITDYRQAHGINEEIVEVDWTGHFWKKAGP